MSDYDFKTLNDKEFEHLCSDILSEVARAQYPNDPQKELARFERFKPGRDLGVDGRYFRDGFEEIILQCKHWANTPLPQLLRHLEKTELPKVRKLAPVRYFLAVSNSLSRIDKRAIASAMAPFIRRDADIFGREDLNDLIKSKPFVEQRHFKLWLCSSSVLTHIFNKPILDRSEFVLEEIREFSKRYAVTDSYRYAYGKLDKLGVVIISGEPGSGKTTLAEQLCLRFVTDGYRFVKIDDDLVEAEAVFAKGEKQIFYFDDFLGRNYLDAMSGHEGSKIVRFIRRVRHDNSKKFVLTSRTTILNQGRQLIDQLSHHNLEQNEYSLSIFAYSDFEKAEILYNHIWHSAFPTRYKDTLLSDKSYRTVIAHPNFTPRLVSLVCESDRAKGVLAENFWGFVLDRLNDPSEIWNHAFAVQQDDFGRSIVLLVTLHGGAMQQGTLALAYSRFIALPQNANFRGRRDFTENLLHLSGSLIVRRMYSNDDVEIDLYSPAVGDYVLKRYATDVYNLHLGFLALQSGACLRTLSHLHSSGIVSENVYQSVLSTVVRDLETKKLTGVDTEYALVAADLTLQLPPNAGSRIDFLRDVATIVAKDQKFCNRALALRIFWWAADSGLFGIRWVADFVAKFEDDDVTTDELDILMAMRRLLGPRDALIAHADVVLRQLVLKNLEELLPDELIHFDVFESVSRDDHLSARKTAEEHVLWRLSAYPLCFSSDDVSSLLSTIRIYQTLEDSRFDNSIEENEYALRDVFLENEIEIDDLFDCS